MTYEEFKKFLTSVRKVDNFIDALNKFNIDLIDTVLYDGIFEIENEFIKNVYDDDAFEIICWYLYEKPNGNECDVFDGNTGKIDIETDRDLWEYLENNHKNNPYPNTLRSTILDYMKYNDIGIGSSSFANDLRSIAEYVDD